jgi:predicted MFS family arabinose efflux permease
MYASAALSAGITRTPVRGWAVNLLVRCQQSSIILTSFTFGLFLPFISADLGLTLQEAGLLQGVWWTTSALLSLPFSTWFSRFRPVPLVLVSLLLMLPFLFLQGVATNFYVLFLARFFLVMFHVVATPARPLLMQQWVAPRDYGWVNAVGLSLHSVLLAVAVSTSALLIGAIGSWRLAYFVQGGFMVVQTVAWLLVARERLAPVKTLQRALQAQQDSPLWPALSYREGWLIGITMFGLSATWTAMVTFLPTLLQEERGISLRLGGPLLAFLYYGLIPSALMGGVLWRRVRNRKHLLWVPALLNVVFGVAIAITPYPLALMALITGMGLVWVVTPAVHALPFEFSGIRPREIAVVTSLVQTFSGLGFAAGPVVTATVAEITGSLQTGLIVLSLLTSVGVIAGLLYPTRLPGARDAVTVSEVDVELERSR